VAATAAHEPIRVPGTAIFMTAQPRGTPPALVHNLRHNKVLHQRVIILSVQTTHTPHVTPDTRLTVTPLGYDLFNVVLRYGFMDEPNVPEALALGTDPVLATDFSDVTYFLGRETVIVTKNPGMAMWREKLFVLMARNAIRATAFFKLPPESVVELGVQVEI
jgi:KUP system potassium uptake protein